MTHQQRLQRWRLVLGEGSEQLGNLTGAGAAQGRALDFLYWRENESVGPPADDRRGGDGPSTLSVPEWVNHVHELFPARTVELLQSDALQRYGIVEVVTDIEALERVEPSESLLKAILQTKHLMNEEVLAAARRIVRLVVEQLVERLRPRLRMSLTGRRNPQRRSHFRVANNFDPRSTIRANLKNWSAERRQLVISEPLFVSRTRRQSERWQVIIAVDQSGSMVDSVIHSAVTASIFHGIPALRTHLVAFDTEVVDLSSEVDDPVETLMKVQLGGGTNIARAMAYCETLVDQPRRALVVLITDLYEGGNEQQLVASVSRLCQQGTRVLVLPALGYDGAPDFDQALAGRLARVGAHVGVMTPHDLAAWVAEMIA